MSKKKLQVPATPAEALAKAFTIKKKPKGEGGSPTTKW